MAPDPGQAPDCPRLLLIAARANGSWSRAGPITALVELLKTGIPSAKDYALWSLSLSISGADQVFESHFPSSPALRCFVLHISSPHLISTPRLHTLSLQAVVAEAGGVQPLINQLADHRVLVQEQAAAALAKLAHENDETRGAISKCGGVRPLIRLLEVGRGLSPPPSPTKMATKMRAEGEEVDMHEFAAAFTAAGADAAARRSRESSEPQDKGRSGGWGNLKAGGLDEAVAPHVIDDPNVKYRSVRQNAAFALANLSDEAAARDEIVGAPRDRHAPRHARIRPHGRAPACIARMTVLAPLESSLASLPCAGAGGIRPLVLALEDDGHQTKRFAATALARLSKAHEATQSAVAEAGAIVPLVALLDGKEGPEAQEVRGGLPAAPWTVLLVAYSLLRGRPLHALPFVPPALRMRFGQSVPMTKVVP